METSDNAFEMRLLTVLSAETANIAFFSCFSIFNDIFLIARFPTIPSNPIKIDTAFFPITAVLQRLLREGQLQLYLTLSQ